MHGIYSEILNPYSKKKKNSISFTLVFVDEEHEEMEEEYEELVRRIHFLISEEGIWIDIDRRNLVWFYLSIIIEYIILKAFRIPVAIKSEGDIMKYILIFEIYIFFFSNI